MQQQWPCKIVLKLVLVEHTPMLGDNPRIKYPPNIITQDYHITQSISSSKLAIFIVVVYHRDGDFEQ